MNPATALNHAVLARNPEALLVALQAGANPNDRFECTMTPLGLLSQDIGTHEGDRASHFLRHAQCVRLLVEHGASLDLPLLDGGQDTLRDRITWRERGLCDAPVYLHGALEAEMSQALTEELGAPAPARARKRL